ncbi:MAG: hypothetical protein ACYC0O_09990 [Desulfurivibrionaceae bacterium]|jgi:hypothetical protein|nr:hypothetical protein [Pseudomonadota bacterium]MCG2822856.1 hypothetical protein [Desulfobulbaceae bacterium]MDP2758163.1 hypothetical protein [Desulfurivibrionaceae bacterium]PKN20126.1 MAG: hypothetical protein CVU68_09195 [Deltaproteobacteria bacterium HGW-Deltaproteobacteria-3]MBU4229137.1 hypothetical protein [Pseudomonadota bacterium]
MTTITQFLDKISLGGLGAEEAMGSVSARDSFRRISEALWGIATFALFLLLGPFSAIAAICSVVSLARQGNGVEPEARC